MRYLPHTEAEIKEMLGAVGVSNIDELFTTIPTNVRLKGDLQLEPSLSEPQLMRHLKELAAKNTSLLSFMGAGMYDHHIPPAVDQLLLRSEFYTAYTPYQSEVSQGTLQCVFEFQTIVAELLGMDVANASMYDGASATAEAATMSRRITGKSKIYVSTLLHPEYIETIRTYLSGLAEAGGNEKGDVILLPHDDKGVTDWAASKSIIKDDAAAVIVGYPNFLGCVEDVRQARELASAVGAMLVTSTQDMYALSLLESPGALGADIAVAEGQALAVPPQLGGPGVGLFACKKEYVQKIPGRLVGETVDQNGTRAFTLTLNTREQHIRRERATSNICSNHSLIALSFTIRTALLGAVGYQKVGEDCLNKAEYLKAELKKKGVQVPYAAPTFNEFVVRLNESAEAFLKRTESKGVIAGVALSRPELSGLHHNPNDLLVAVTEKHSKADLDLLLSCF